MPRTEFLLEISNELICKREIQYKLLVPHDRK